MTRRNFICGAGASFAATAFGVGGEKDVLDRWQAETDLVRPESYLSYLRDGDTRGFASLEKLEAGFQKVMEEVKTCPVTGVPAVWHVYNMGYVVKTRESLFSIDLVHRRSCEFAPLLDFALITHNHDDHYRPDFYRAMDGAKKTVVSNFLDNYGAGRGAGGYTRAERTFRLKDVEIRTSLVDHNAYLVDFTTAFEIRVGDWILYHTGDCGVASKLRTTWGSPDLWVFFPGCGVNVADAERNVRPKQMSFGHLWELGHRTGRLTTPMVRAARKKALDAGTQNLTVPLWGERIV